MLLSKLKKISELILNEKYSEIVPRHTPEEYASLRDSIDMEGQKDPIVINNKGVILDGYTRYEILQNLGREIETRVKQFSNIKDEEYYVIETNLNRRHLNAFQKVELSQKLHDQIRKQLKDRQRLGENYNGGDGKNLNWRKELSKKIGIGENQCQQGMALIKRNDMETIMNLREGKISIEKAYRDTIYSGSHPTDAQRKYMSHGLECPRCHHKASRKNFIVTNGVPNNG